MCLFGFPRSGSVAPLVLCGLRSCGGPVLLSARAWRGACRLPLLRCLGFAMSVQFAVVAVAASGPEVVVWVFDTCVEADAAALVANRVDPDSDYRVSEFEMGLTEDDLDELAAEHAHNLSCFQTGSF